MPNSDTIALLGLGMGLVINSIALIYALTWKIATMTARIEALNYLSSANISEHHKLNESIDRVETFFSPLALLEDKVNTIYKIYILDALESLKQGKIPSNPGMPDWIKNIIALHCAREKTQHQDCLNIMDEIAALLLTDYWDDFKKFISQYGLCELAELVFVEIMQQRSGCPKCTIPCINKSEQKMP